MLFRGTARPPLWRLLAAIVIIAAAAAARAAFLDFLGPRVPYVTFLPAVLVVVLYCGVPAGLLAGLLSIVYASIWIGPLDQVLIVRDSADRLILTISISSGLILYVSAKALQRAQARAADAEAQIELVTQHRMIDAKLRESDARYRALFENSMDAVFLTMPGGEIAAANSAACRLFDMTEEEICQTGTAVLLDLPDSGLTTVIGGRSGTNNHRLELSCLRKNGLRFLAEVTTANVAGNWGSFLILHDITERKQLEGEILSLNAGLEQRVKQRTAELEEAIREQESFSYTVSHDLRAPLRHINSFSAILIEEHGESLSEEAFGYLERIGSTTRRMGVLIDRLLELARVVRTGMNLEDVGLSEMAWSIVSMLRATEPERRVEVTIEGDLQAVGDRVLLRQMLENLIGNAWKYSSLRSPARVEFGSTPSHGSQSFYIKDNGVGFDMAYSKKLFAIFERLHGPEFEGDGIGLATAQRIIHRHGGTIWAESAVDAGATFFFTIPLPTDNPSSCPQHHNIKT